MNFETQLHTGLATQVAAVELAQAKHAELLHAAQNRIQTESASGTPSRLAFTLAYLIRRYTYRLAPRLAFRQAL